MSRAGDPRRARHEPRRRARDDGLAARVGVRPAAWPQRRRHGAAAGRARRGRRVPHGDHPRDHALPPGAAERGAAPRRQADQDRRGALPAGSRPVRERYLVHHDPVIYPEPVRASTPSASSAGPRARTRGSRSAAAGAAASARASPSRRCTSSCARCSRATTSRRRRRRPERTRRRSITISPAAAGVSCCGRARRGRRPPTRWRKRPDASAPRGRAYASARAAHWVSAVHSRPVTPGCSDSATARRSAHSTATVAGVSARRSSRPAGPFARRTRLIAVPGPSEPVRAPVVSASEPRAGPTGRGRSSSAASAERAVAARRAGAARRRSRAPNGPPARSRR